MGETEGLMWIDGEFYPAGEAKISVLDAGFWLGINVFDTFSARHGFIFKLEAHLERFYRSLQAVRLDIPYSREELGRLVVETTRRSGLRDAYINCIATRGLRAPSRIDQWKPSTIIWAIPYAGILNEDVIQRGAKARIASVRNMPVQCVDPKIKNLNRLHFYLARLEAYDAGADTAIMLDLDGHVMENPGANVFTIKNGRLYTPGEGVLEGVTRETVLEIAQREGVPATTGRLSPYDLYNADEVFLSSTLGGLLPVVEVDGRRIAAGQIGSITKRFQEIYWRMHVEGEHATPIYAG